MCIWNAPGSLQPDVRSVDHWLRRGRSYEASSSSSSSCESAPSGVWASHPLLRRANRAHRETTSTRRSLDNISANGHRSPYASVLASRIVTTPGAAGERALASQRRRIRPVHGLDLRWVMGGVHTSTRDQDRRWSDDDTPPSMAMLGRRDRDCGFANTVAGRDVRNRPHDARRAVGTVSGSRGGTSCGRFQGRSFAQRRTRRACEPHTVWTAR